jgi:hypothetical protein
MKILDNIIKHVIIPLLVLAVIAIVLLIGWIGAFVVTLIIG